MRTTVTIDPDTEVLLREEVRQSGKSFKRVLNEAIRSALGRGNHPTTVRPIFSAPFPLSLDTQSFNHLSDEWDDEETVEELSGS